MFASVVIIIIFTMKRIPTYCPPLIWRLKTVVLRSPASEATKPLQFFLLNAQMQKGQLDTRIPDCDSLQPIHVCGKMMPTIGNVCKTQIHHTGAMASNE